MVSLNSDSSGLIHRASAGSRTSSTDVLSVKFKTRRNAGSLLLAEGQRGLGLSLELQRGTLQLLINKGRNSSRPQGLLGDVDVPL